MKTTLTALAAVIAALSMVQLLACASRTEAPDPVKVQEEIAEYRLQELELIRTTVLDDERADRLIHLLGERDRLISGYAKEISAHRIHMAELNADYNADRESFDILMASYNSRRAVAQKELIDLIGAMKKQTTPGEWKVISKFQLKTLHPRSLVYSQSAAGD
jgi:hypothetical protein